MTRDAGFKRRVRDRMARTGESHATARAQLLGRADELHTDRWVGGVRMRETAWRWDEATERLVVRPEG